jgi:hypothetical protein
MSKKMFGKVFILLLVVGLLFAALPTEQAQAAEICTTHCYVSPSGSDSNYGNSDDPFLTIQKAIDTVSDGGTIHLAEGNYLENPKTTIAINKSFNLIGADDGSGTALSTIQGTLSLENSLTTDSYLIQYINFKQVSGFDSLIIKQIDNLTVRYSVFAGAGTITERAIQMNSGGNGNQNIVIDSCRFENLYYIGIQGSVKTLTVKDSEFVNLKSGINLQSGESDLTVTGSTFNVVAQGVSNDTYGIRLASDTPGSGESLNVTGSTFTVDKNGFVADPGTYHAAIIIRAGATGPFTVEDNQILGDVVNLATPSLDISPNWWGSADGPAAGQLVGTATYIPWCGDAACETLITPTVHNTTKGTWHVTIQGAIDAAADGDVIEVGPGEYPEYVELRTPNITVRSTGGAAVTKIVTPPGSLTTGVKVLANMGTVTFDGFTVKNFTESGIIQGMADRTGTTFHVLNNIVEPYADYLRNGIQVSGDGSTVIGNTVYGKRLTDEWASAGITVANASNVTVKDNTIIGGVTGVDNGIVLIAYYNDMSNITIEGNTITDAFDGVNLQGNYWATTRFSISDVSIKSNIISDSSEGIGAYWLTNLTDVLVEKNQFNDLVYGGLWIDDTVVGTVTGVDASPNWWGSIAGPDQEYVLENDEDLVVSQTSIRG